MGLSLVIPNGQSLIADYYEDLDRGKAFGALYLTGAVGAMIGALYATNIGSAALLDPKFMILTKSAACCTRILFRSHNGRHLVEVDGDR